MHNYQPKFITCPKCNGAGNINGTRCRYCQGLGMGIIWGSKFLYWKMPLNSLIIWQDSVKRKFDFIVNFLLFSYSFLGILSLLYFIYLNIRENNYFVLEQIWQQQSLLLFLFWSSIFAAMFIAFRFDQENKEEKKINKKLFDYEYLKYNFTADNWKEILELPKKDKINIADYFSKNSKEIIKKSFLLAKKLNHSNIKPIHLFAELIQVRRVNIIEFRLAIDFQKLVKFTKDSLIKIIKHTKENPSISFEVLKTLFNAFIIAEQQNQYNVMPEDLLLAIQQDRDIDEILYELNVDQQKLKNTIIWLRINRKLKEQVKKYHKKALLKPKGTMNRAMTAVATPILDYYGKDLTMLAKYGHLPLCVSREVEINNIFRLIESGQQGIILTGEVGVGKNSIINGIAQKMVEEDVPKILEDKRLVELDIARLAGGVDASKAGKRLIAILDEIQRAKNIVLFIDDIENMIGITSGSEESLDLSEILLEGLESHYFICLAIASEKNYLHYIETTALGQSFKRLIIKQPNTNQTIQIIESKVGFIEYKNKVYFSYRAIESIVNLSNKYIQDKFQPAKSIDLLQEIAVYAHRKNGDKSLITHYEVEEVISKKTNIPLTKLTENETKKLLDLEDEIHKKFINQNAAVKMVAQSLRRARAQLRESVRPIANLLFLGPTGVGKTELAKIVSEIYFGNRKNMIRLDMSEYQTSQSIYSLIGSADGSILGHLTEAVRKNPFSLILLDEFEKANKQILNIFLQVFDDARLTDGQGRTINFANSIIIATSNAASNFIQEQLRIGNNIDKIRKILIENELKKYFAPELLNRFDGIIVFQPLTMDNVKEITKLMLNSARKELELKGIGLSVSDKAVAELAKLGYNPAYGARPLRRAIQDNLQNQIANILLSKQVQRRDIIIVNSIKNIIIKKANAL